MLLFTRVILIALSAASTSGFAQNANPSGSLYVSGGYDYLDIEGVTLGSVQARLGHNLTRHLAIEGIGGFGVDEDAVLGAKARIRSSLGGFVVANALMSDRLTLIGRLGYVQTWAELEARGFKVQRDVGSVAIGVGAQFQFDDVNGVRSDYTHYPSDDGIKGFTISYVRKF